MNFTKWGEGGESLGEARGKEKIIINKNNISKKIIIKTIQEIYKNHSTSLISAIYIFTKGEYNS